MRDRLAWRGPCVLALIVLGLSMPAGAASLWSDDRTQGGGPGQFFGPGSWPQVEKLFAVNIHHMGFLTDVDFMTPFRNLGPGGPRTAGEIAFGVTNGTISDGSLINENVDTGPLTVAGTSVLPVVARSDGKFGGSQVAVSLRDGEIHMVMDITIDLRIGPRGIIKIPFYGTTGTVAVPFSLQTQAGGKGVDMAGPLASGTTLTGRIGDFRHDGFIGGVLVAAGVMPLTSPIYPGQPFAMVRNFETDVWMDGRKFGSVRSNAVSYRPPSE